MSRIIEILEHHKQFIEFVRKLEKLDEHVLRTPIAEAKWSIIEVIGHFQLWDEFLLHQRLPFIFTNSTLPAAPNTNELNATSARLAQENSIQNTIEQLILTRNKLINHLNQISKENWSIEFKINHSTLTLETYLLGLIDHDLHHLNQINLFLKRILMDS